MTDEAPKPLDGGVVIFAGRRGSGKTHRIREYVTRLVARKRSVVAFDVSQDIYGKKPGEGLSSYYRNRHDRTELIGKYPTVAAYIEHEKRATAPVSGVVWKPVPRCACICPDNPDTLEAEAKAFRALMATQCKKGKAWVCDEGELVFTDYGVKSGAFALITLSRNFSSLIIIACKDPIRVSTDARRGADAAFVFALNTREAVLSLRDIIDPQVCMGVTTFPKRRFLYVAPATEERARARPVVLDADDPLPLDL